MKTLQKLLALLLALVLVLGLCACAKDEAGTDDPAASNNGGETTTPSGDEGTGEGEAADRSLIIGTTIAPATFLSSTGSVNSYTNMLFDSLMMYNDKGELVPALATEWEYTDDYTLQLTLRDYVYFT